MLTLLSINWNPNPELFNLFGSLPIRYYGLLWVVGIALAYVIVHRQYHDRKIDEKTFEPLFFYCFFGILIGARLGHCLFYQPDYYLNHFWEIILPVKFLPDGGWKFTGYEGLASHGGTLGLIIALWMYCRKTKMHYMDVLDMIAVATPVTACCIRLANLMNSEIIGKPTDPGLSSLNGWRCCPAIRHSSTRQSPTSSSSWSWSTCTGADKSSRKTSSKRTSAPPKPSPPQCKPALPYPITAVSSSASA